MTRIPKQLAFKHMLMWIGQAKVGPVRCSRHLSHIHVRRLLRPQDGWLPAGFLLGPLGRAAEPLASIVNAEPTLLADLFEMSQPRLIQRVRPVWRNRSLSWRGGAGVVPIAATPDDKSPSFDHSRASVGARLNLI